ncbi:hypothetical protein WME89_26160 [Sorangium sp. So ce321]|uniref:hypothetical protein n=1 Tax=Sorangium sp. So ce321 TaxID=3133300 RepID=UPI003F5F4658
MTSPSRTLAGLPHPATVAQPKAPHPATAAQPKAPHLATVAQSKAPHLATVAQPKAPHPATVAQSKAPHSATVAQPKAPHPATVAQPKAPHPTMTPRIGGHFNAAAVQLASNENLEHVRVETPVRVNTTSKFMYLLEGNDKYGRQHIEKHDSEVVNVGRRRGWGDTVVDVLRNAITQSKYSAYETIEKGGSKVVRIPVTARRVLRIPIADDGKIITVYVEHSNTKDIRLFWQMAPDVIASKGWKIAKGEIPGDMADAPWDLYAE